MPRFSIAATIACLGVVFAADAGVHSITRRQPVASQSDPNTIVVESYDLTIDQIPPNELWRSTSISVGLDLAESGGVRFSVIDPQLAPPRGAAGPGYQGTFFSTAREFPNANGTGDPTYDAEFSVLADLIAGSWSSQLAADGAGPSFVAFRLQLARPIGSPELTLEPIGTPIVTIQGSSIFTSERFVPGASFEFNIYRVPEPAAGLLGLAATLLVRRR